MTSLALWRDRRGRTSWLRIAALALLAWPAALAAGTAASVGLGPRPWNDLIHRTGWWALVFLLLSLAITPLRRAGHWAKLIDVRRMIGVGAFAYGAAHLALYVVDEKLDLVKVASEIVSRLYLTIGFVALLGVTALAITSNDAMVKRLGGLRWRQLHQVTYALGVLALVHFFQQTKADVSVPTLYAGLFVWLIGYRIVARLNGEGELGTGALALLAIVSGALTLVGEAIGIGLAFGVPPLMILAAAFDPDLGIRPGWYVLAAGLAVTLLNVVRGWMTRRRADRTPAWGGAARPMSPLAKGTLLP
ncbi:MAG: sulfoxide reductase heme-binding subunit YedZ [Methylobacteriaceae bacterium]|nr:sulfoxide reductase heme-binding subunit YedZ [Methylobacteriaceae bacterium]